MDLCLWIREVAVHIAYTEHARAGINRKHIVYFAEVEDLLKEEGTTTD